MLGRERRYLFVVTFSQSNLSSIIDLIQNNSTPAKKGGLLVEFRCTISELEVALIGCNATHGFEQEERLTWYIQLYYNTYSFDQSNHILPTMLNYVLQSIF